VQKEEKQLMQQQKNRAKKNPIYEDRVCGDKWTRTTDSRIFSPMLYQLSYITILLSVANVEK
jgi:hypothetical protein